MGSLVNFLFVFFVCMSISATLNVLFKMTRKKDWIVSFLISILLSFFINILLAG
ncbi:hypothetical protein [Sutcliffiella cohnii]|uniref:hypothetical protein n=1 Tax=Sutcliffiella cohnii TaxID=33932 RepID=UPI002E1C9C0A|nr:hypothetical protein [Sutcliffiella cohnii]